MKPLLKAPGSQRLKQKYGELLSIFAINLYLRRYVTGGGGGARRVNTRAVAAVDRTSLTSTPVAGPSQLRPRAAALPTGTVDVARFAVLSQPAGYSSTETPSAGAYTRPLLSST